MGNCKIDGISDINESQKEVKIDDKDSFLMSQLEEYNSKDKIGKKYKYINKNNKNKEYNYKIKKNLLVNKKLNLNKNIDKLEKNRSDCNEEDLVVITPRHYNNIYGDSYQNEITDEFTIKNETLVYINDYISNKGSEGEKNVEKKINTNSNKIKEKDNHKNINRNSNRNSNKSKNNKKGKINNSVHNINKNRNNFKNNNSLKEHKNNLNILKKRMVQKNNNLNQLNKEIPSVKMNAIEYNKINNDIIGDINEFKIMNNLKQTSGDYLNKRKAKSKKNSKVFNKSYNDINFNKFGVNQFFDSFQLPDIIKGNQNPQSSTLQKQNIELGNLLFNNMQIINSDDIIPNIERKTYKEDLDLQQGEHKINNEIEYNNIKVPIFRKKTYFHIRNKSYNKYDFLNNNITNDNSNDNNYFSLFNNSANLSINFIHNKFNKSSNNMQQTQPTIDNQNIISERNNKSYCHKNVYKKNINNKIEKKQPNPYINYSNFNKKRNPNKKVKNRSNLQKVKPGLSYSRSYNNIFQVNKENNYEFNNTNSNINNLVLSSEQYRDMLEVYIPKIERKTLICNEIINRAGNKYIFSYEKMDYFNAEQILYDGVVYKVVDGIENSEEEYQFLERYFQITKNCFKYFNNINEAIKDKEKPLVQFDVRHIKNIEIIDNNIFGQSKINGKKNINIIFCVYIKDNNDFFVFAHYNRNIGNNLINILQFLIRYYEDNY